jgi:hypothetical protein
MRASTEGTYEPPARPSLVLSSGERRKYEVNQRQRLHRQDAKDGGLGVNDAATATALNAE